MTEYVQSFERGLAVIQSFSADAPMQTLAEVARATGLPRATARRLLLTLEHLGYVRSNGRGYELTPKVLDIGYSYLSSLDMQSIAQPYMEEFSQRVNESSSVSVLDDTDIVYVARVPTRRVMTVSIGLGSRFPAFQTSMGRVLLAELDDDSVRDIFARSSRNYWTPRTVATADELLERLAAVREQGWALVDEELELGVRSLGAPLRDVSGSVVAAINVSSHAGRTELADVLGSFLAALLETAARISDALGKRGMRTETRPRRG